VRIDTIDNPFLFKVISNQPPDNNNRNPNYRQYPQWHVNPLYSYNRNYIQPETCDCYYEVDVTIPPCEPDVLRDEFICECHKVLHRNLPVWYHTIDFKDIYTEENEDYE